MPRAKKTSPSRTPKKGTKKVAKNAKLTIADVEKLSDKFKVKPFTTTDEWNDEELELFHEVKSKDFKKLANILKMPDSFQKSEGFKYLARTIVLNYPEAASIKNFGPILADCITEYIKGQIIAFKGKIYLQIDAADAFTSNWKDLSVSDTAFRDSIISLFVDAVRNRTGKVLEKFKHF